MNSIPYNKKNILSRNEESSKALQLGGSMILGPKFDIKKYLNINYQEKSAKKEKSNIPQLFDNLYKRTKNDNKKYQLSTIVNENISNHRNKLRIKKPSIDISTTISYNNSIDINKNNSNTINTINDNNSIIYDKLKLNKNSSRKTYIETDKNLDSLELYKKIFEKNNDKKLNFSKTIKTIKKCVELSKRNKSIKNKMENRIAYDPKNLDVIFKPINIINDYENYKQQKLSPNTIDIKTFLTNSNDISKNNLMIKLLKNQQNNYNKEINEHQKTIDNNRRVLRLYENSFLDYKTNQKIASRKIDDLLTKLIIANRLLLREKYKLNSEVRVKEDERQKLLERIDELRIIAKFVTKVLDCNLEIFNIKIIPEYSSERLPNYDLIAKELFERFNFLLNENENLNEEDMNIIKQINLLNDSELLFRQFHKIEEEIINTLNNKEVIDKEIVDITKEGIKQNKDIGKRIEDLENELNLYNSLYEREKMEFEEVYKRINSGDREINDLIKELYLNVMNIENNIKNKNNIINISKAVTVLKKEIIRKEDNINKLLLTLEKCEIENKNLFYRIVNNRKNELKEMKVTIMKHKIEEGEKEKENQIKPNEKLIFIQRKCEPPYHAPKKEKKEKVDPELIKNMENEELIAYE